MTVYQLNPHKHVKIWLSKDPNVFMNFENQTRLLEMRETNPKDIIHLIYDSTLLNETALEELHAFCKENEIIPVDAQSFIQQLETDEEKKLFEFYKDEIEHLDEGGNLGVASDILRWLSASYRLGSYTDMDVPLDTRHLPELVEVNAPILLNVGSLQLLGKTEMLLALNEFIAVTDESQAKEKIQQVHQGLINKLSNYSSDYIEQTEKMLDQNNWVNRRMLGYMKNRPEALYIDRTNLLQPGKSLSSRELRGYVSATMSDRQKYLDFCKLPGEESHEMVIQRLRNELKENFGFIKWFFFNKEYNAMKRLLAQDDEQFIELLMGKERSLYIKSIVVCTTGPMEVGKSFFKNYILSSSDVEEQAKPVAFSTYNLHKAFLSRNVVPLHQNAVKMLQYLGADVGELNDSSWLEEGMRLQEIRKNLLLDKRAALIKSLPSMLHCEKQKIEAQIKTLQKETNSFFSLFKSRKQEKIKALQLVLGCFSEEEKTLDVAKLQTALTVIDANKAVFSGFFSSRTNKLIENIRKLRHDAVVYQLTKDKLINLEDTSSSASVLAALGTPVQNRPTQKDEQEHGCFSCLFKPKTINPQDDTPSFAPSV